MNIMQNYATLYIMQLALSFILKLKMINHESDINKNIFICKRSIQSKISIFN